MFTSIVTRFGLPDEGVGSNLCIRSFKPDARRSNVEPVGSGGTGVLAVLRDDPFGVDGLGVGFFSSTRRPRVFVEVAAGSTLARTSFDPPAAVDEDTEGVEGRETGGGGGGDGSCSTMTASFERKRNGERCRNVLRMPFDGR